MATENTTAIEAAIQTRRGELLQPLIESITAGTVLTPKEQRFALRSLVGLINTVAQHEGLTREFVHVVEGIRHAQKQAEAAHDKAREFMNRMQGAPCSS